MPDTGWLNSGIKTQEETSEVFWNDLAFINTGTNDAEVTLNPGENSRELNFFSYNLPAIIPENAVVTGVEVRVDAFANTGVIGLGDLEVRLRVGTTTVSPDNKAKLFIMPTSRTYTVYGGANDAWGWSQSYLSTAINSAQFGFLWQADYAAAKGSPDTINVGFAQMKVHWALPNRQRGGLGFGFGFGF